MINPHISATAFWNSPATLWRLLQSCKARSQGVKSNKIGYIGWIGKENLGDEAMFSAAQKLLAPKELIHYDGKNRERLLAFLGLSGRKYFSSIILGGGTLVNQGYKEIVHLALSSGLDMSTLGTGVGSNGFSADPHESLHEWSPLLNRFRFLGLRGPRSLQRIKEIGVEHAEIVGDLALALTLDSPQPSPVSDRYMLNVAIPGVGAPAFPTDKMIAEISHAVAVLSQKGLYPLPVAFCPEDILALSLVLTKALSETYDIKLINDYQEMFRHLSKCRFSIGVRLHSAVLSCCAGVPPILIGYREKCADFMESMELMEWYIDALSMDKGKIAGLVEKLVAAEHSLRPVINKRALFWKERLREYTAQYA